MIPKKKYQEIIFLDVKTSPLDLTSDGIELFEKKNKTDQELYAEFSRISSISYGKIKYELDDKSYKKFTKSIVSANEKALLEKFILVCDKQVVNDGTIMFCGHNIEKRDIPFLVKRMIINGIKIPKYLDLTDNYKPWTSNIIDIIKIWDLTSYSATSLQLLVYSLLPDKYNKEDFSEINYSEPSSKHLNLVMDLIIKLQEAYD